MFRKNLIVHHKEHGIIYCITQYIIPCSWWWTTRFVRNMQSRQKLWNEIDYKKCGSRCSLTHCNMMHGTYNVKSILLLSRLLPDSSSCHLPLDYHTKLCVIYIYRLLSVCNVYQTSHFPSFHHSKSIVDRQKRLIYNK